MCHSGVLGWDCRHRVPRQWAPLVLTNRGRWRTGGHWKGFPGATVMMVFWLELPICSDRSVPVPCHGAILLLTSGPLLLLCFPSIGGSSSLYQILAIRRAGVVWFPLLEAPLLLQSFLDISGGLYVAFTICLLPSYCCVYFLKSSLFYDTV